MTEDHYRRFLEQLENKKDIRDFLFNAFVVFTEMIKRHIFPGDWVVIIMLANKWVIIDDDGDNDDDDDDDDNDDDDDDDVDDDDNSDDDESDDNDDDDADDDDDVDDDDSDDDDSDDDDDDVDDHFPNFNVPFV